MTIINSLIKGKQPIIDTLNVTPTTSAQQITAPTGTDGYSPVNVSAVTSSIDANIVAGNIKKDVQILGVTGSYEGVVPSGTKPITSNGIHDVAGYANADVQVPTTAPAYYIEKTKDANGKLINSTNIINLNGVADVGNSVLGYAYYNISFPANTSVDLSGLTAISGNYACQYMFSTCTGITNVDLSDLTTVSGQYACSNMLRSCNSITSADLSSLTTISGMYACYSMFNGCTRLTTVNLSSLTTTSGSYACNVMFSGCIGLTSVDLSSLTTASGESSCSNMFYGCTGLTSVDLSSLTTVSGRNACYHMFDGCTGLTSADLSSLTTISGESSCSNMFYGCGLTSVYLKSLRRIENSSTRTVSLSQMFGNCSVVDLRNLQYAGDYTIDSLCYLNNTLSSINLNSLEHIGKEGARTMFYLTSPSSSLSNIYFPMLTSFGSNPFYSNAFTGRTNLTIHFRKDAQATVEALQNYATLWGAGTGSSVVFDLAGTLTGADSNLYDRSEKDSVYASETAGAAKTATAWEYNNTIYYTSGGAEPQVGDTIYSDSACTTAVTTVSAIA